MIADLQMIEVPLAKARVGGSRVDYEMALLEWPLSDESIGILVRFDGCILAVFANSYSPGVREFLEQSNFAWISNGCKALELRLDVGYCRVIESLKFKRALIDDESVCSEIRNQLVGLLV